MGDNLRLKLSEERLHDLGRAEERPKLQTPRVSTRCVDKVRKFLVMKTLFQAFEL